MTNIGEAKFCLISLENKKFYKFSHIAPLLEKLSSLGICFDKISHVAFDDAGEITAAFKEAKRSYSDVFVFCPNTMEEAVISYVSKLFGAPFEGGRLNAGSATVQIVLAGKNDIYEDICGFLRRKYEIETQNFYVRLFCPQREIVEAALTQVKDIIQNSSINFNLYESFGDYTLEFIQPLFISQATVAELKRRLLTALDGYVYALENIALAEQLYRLLKLRKLKIAVAESFTGGGVGKKLVEVPGVSEVYFEGINAYSNQAKSARLGVSEITLKKYGAVSAETAIEMAQGLVASGACAVSVSTTGIAGPSSDNTKKPVGLAYVAACVEGETVVREFNFKGDRERITNLGINAALFLVYDTLKKSGDLKI